jgi:hypothetical protein
MPGGDVLARQRHEIGQVGLAAGPRHGCRRPRADRARSRRAGATGGDLPGPQARGQVEDLDRHPDMVVGAGRLADRAARIDRRLQHVRPGRRGVGHLDVHLHPPAAREAPARSSGQRVAALLRVREDSRRAGIGRVEVDRPEEAPRGQAEHGARHRAGVNRGRGGDAAVGPDQLPLEISRETLNDRLRVRRQDHAVLPHRHDPAGTAHVEFQRTAGDREHRAGRQRPLAVTRREVRIGAHQQLEVRGRRTRRRPSTGRRPRCRPAGTHRHHAHGRQDRDPSSR